MSSWSMKMTCRWLAAFALLSQPASAFAQVARIEYHAFQTTTLTDEQFLVGSKDGKPVVIAGELRIPPRTGPLPLVILVHGSGGVFGLIDDWAAKLNALGVATFAFDSFTGRGIETTREDQAQLGRLAMIVDAYRALALMSKHPRIAPDRIALMGFSRGGQAALYAGVKRFQRMHAPADAAFALFIPFYPNCSTRYLEDLDVVDKPIRIFHGSDDDWAPVAPCRAYVDELLKAKKDVRLTQYPGSHHLFDFAGIKAPTKVPKAQSMRRCQTEEVSEGRIVNVQTRQVFTYADPCVERGTTMAYDAEAAAAAVKAVTELVSTILKPQISAAK